MNGVSGKSQTPQTTFPKALFQYKDYVPVPTVVYIRDEDEANRLVSNMEELVGFDMEWHVPNRNNNSQDGKVALVQLADTHMILLIHVCCMENFPQKVKEFIVTIYYQARNDGEKLCRDHAVVAKNLVELSEVAKQADSRYDVRFNIFPGRRWPVGLANMVEEYLNKKIDKGPIRLSNWENNPLTEEQKTYAANDAYSALLIYKYLVKMANDNHVELNPDLHTLDVKKPQKKIHVTRWHSKTVAQPGDKPAPRYMRAYTMWHDKQASLDEMCESLKTTSKSLAKGTVIGYVVGAIQSNPSLPFDMDRLKDFVQLDEGSWERHGAWVKELGNLLAEA